MRCRSGKCGRKKKKIGITVGGPMPGLRFIIKPDKQHYFFATPTDPVYCGVYYTLVNRLTLLKEQMATFAHSLERNKSCQKG